MVDLGSRRSNLAELDVHWQTIRQYHRAAVATVRFWAWSRWHCNLAAKVHLPLRQLTKTSDPAWKNLRFALVYCLTQVQSWGSGLIIQ